MIESNGVSPFIKDTGKTVYISANDKDNNINVNHKGDVTEVTIDKEKFTFKGDKNIVIDAGGGKDNVTVSSLPVPKVQVAPTITIIGGEGDDNINFKGNEHNVNIIDNGPKSPFSFDLFPCDSLVDNHLTEIQAVLSRKSENGLELKDKERILNILNKSRTDSSLGQLVDKLNSEKQLLSLYKDMGILVNQSEKGNIISGALAPLTLFTSLAAQMKLDKTFNMKEIFREGNIAEDIINKLK